MLPAPKLLRGANRSNKLNLAFIGVGGRARPIEGKQF
jgi:hypothetical protein